MMSKLFTPTLRLTIGLIALTISLIMGAFVLGLVPDESRAEIEARGKIAEALAMQLASAATRSDVVVIQETLLAVEKRNDAVLSVALRRANGKILIATRDHHVHWVEPTDRKSTPTHVQVPLLNGNKVWGEIEIAFRPLQSEELFAGDKRPVAVICRSEHGEHIFNTDGRQIDAVELQALMTEQTE